MNEPILIFHSEQFGDIRTAGNTESPLFCLADVCKTLGLTPKFVSQRLSDEVVSNHPIADRLGREQQALFVNEDGLYDVILDSRKPEAKAFRKWITSEVLPSIRKNGGYMATKADETHEEVMARAILIAKETIDRQANQLKQQAPKVLFATAVETSDRSVLVAELAKIISQNGVEIGQNRLFKWLRKNGYLCSKGEYYNQPTQRSMEMELFELKKTSISKPDGSVLVSTTTKVSGKGQVYFVNKFLQTDK